MTTVEEIVSAARKLSPAQLLRLKKKLEQLESSQWQNELAKSTAEMKEKKISDAVIDRMIMRRRRESRR